MGTITKTEHASAEAHRFADEREDAAGNVVVTPRSYWRRVVRIAGYAIEYRHAADGPDRIREVDFDMKIDRLSGILLRKVYASDGVD